MIDEIIAGIDTNMQLASEVNNIYSCRFMIIFKIIYINIYKYTHMHRMIYIVN